MTDTLYAPGTASGRAAVAMVRLSGPGCRRVLEMLAGSAPAPRRAALRRLVDPRDGAELDRALVLWLPGPASYTGEDQAELHLHGGPAVVEAVLAALAALDLGGDPSGERLRLAEPGEFTRRAYAHGRMDLAEAEAVADLVDAETDAQRRQALAQLGGALSGVQARWRDLLLDGLAHLEAAVDFPDEDLPTEVAARARPPLARLRSELAATATDRRGERVREGFRIALLGAPNAGKSSLLNRLAGREAAIVTAVPGTTRDVVEVVLEIAGRRVVLADTAGLRDTDDPIEAEGVRRAQAWAHGADLRLWLADRTGPPPPTPDLTVPGDVLVLAKSDTPGLWTADAARPWARAAGLDFVESSTVAEAGVDALRAVLEAAVVGSGDPPVVTRLRHRAVLAAALAELDRALADLDASPELAAESVRLAARALARLTGAVDAEAVLDRVFSSFCIGK